MTLDHGDSFQPPPDAQHFELDGAHLAVWGTRTRLICWSLWHEPGDEEARAFALRRYGHCRMRLVGWLTPAGRVNLTLDSFNDSLGVDLALLEKLVQVLRSAQSTLAEAP